MKPTFEMRQFPEKQELLRSIEAAELRAGELGLHISARALNRAKNAVGWEMSGNLKEADNAAFGRGIGARP